MPSHTYPYSEPIKHSRNWPVIILGILGIIILIGIIWYFVVNPLLSVSDQADNLLNHTQNQGDNVNNNNNNSAGSLGNNTYDCFSDVYNCGNFTTQAEAQQVFDYCFSTVGDIHGLDADGNGKGCESLE